MEVMKEEFITDVEAKMMLEERKKKKDLVYEQKICFEYLEKTAKLTPAQLKSMQAGLAKIAILRPKYTAMIINMMPETEEEVNALFEKERTALKKEEVKQIVDIVLNHKK